MLQPGDSQRKQPLVFLIAFALPNTELFCEDIDSEVAGAAGVYWHKRLGHATVAPFSSVRWPRAPSGPRRTATTAPRPRHAMTCWPT